MPKAQKILTFARVIIEQLWGLPGERTRGGVYCSTELFWTILSQSVVNLGDESWTLYTQLQTHNGPKNLGYSLVWAAVEEFLVLFLFLFVALLTNQESPRFYMLGRSLG